MCYLIIIFTGDSSKQIFCLLRLFLIFLFFYFFIFSFPYSFKGHVASVWFFISFPSWRLVKGFFCFPSENHLKGIKVPSLVWFFCLLLWFVGFRFYVLIPKREKQKNKEENYCTSLIISLFPSSPSLALQGSSSAGGAVPSLSASHTTDSAAL